MILDARYSILDGSILDPRWLDARYSMLDPEYSIRDTISYILYPHRASEHPASSIQHRASSIEDRSLLTLLPSEERESASSSFLRSL
ncbi:MAG: hypothetical protein AB1797_08505 [bacterium]